MNRGRGSDRGRNSPSGPGRGGRGRGSPDAHGRGGHSPSFRGRDRGGGRGYHDRGGPRGRAKGSIVMRGQPEPAEIDRRIADNSDKQLVATFAASSSGSGPGSMPIRPDFGTEGREIALRTNLFPVRVPKGPLYEYGVSITPAFGAVLRRVKKRIYQLAEQTTTWAQAEMTGKVAHDGSAKLIAAFLLPQPLTIRVPYYEEDESGPPQNGGREYTLTIKFIQEIDTSNLVSYLAGQAQFRGYNILPVISALNIILSSAPGRSGVMVEHNRHIFNRAGAQKTFNLGGGLEVWEGFYQTIRAVHRQLMVNVDVCRTAFYIPGNLALAMVAFRDSSFGARMDTFCRGVRIRVSHLRSRKTVKQLAQHTARTYSFDTPEYGRVNVEQYFKRRHNIHLIYPDLYLVDVGVQQTNYLPAELCTILPDQPFRGKLTKEHTTQMIEITCQPLNVNGEAIVDQGLDHLGLRVSGPELQAFSMSVGPNMVVVPGRILPKPEITYSSSTASIDEKASWNLRGVKFARGARLDKWTVLVIKDNTRDEFGGSSDPELFEVVAGFRSMCNVSGMQITADPIYATAVLPPKSPSDPMRQAAIDIIKVTLMGVKTEPTLVFVMLAGDDKAVYEGLKHLCDISLDVATVCVQSSKIRKKSPQYYANVALKVNMKLGGINHRLDINSGRWLSAAPTMIVGMDVTHPSPGSAVGTPSVAAVVASVDDHVAQYPASLGIQGFRREMITNLKDMMVGRLKLFLKCNGRLPERILIYRSGVSEGQFNIIGLEEKRLIFEAFNDFSTPTTQYRPKLTIIICSKRYHTHFYPTEESNVTADGNLCPGTVVDRGVTTIYDFDFFLQAHSGSRGTARPTHYCVVHDEIGFKADEIQELTNSLSYMFSRATKAVSLVSPAYYANVACKRGRCYLRKLLHGYLGDGTASDTGSVTEQDVMREAQNLWHGGLPKGLRDTMFYL